MALDRRAQIGKVSVASIFDDMCFTPTVAETPSNRRTPPRTPKNTVSVSNATRGASAVAEIAAQVPLTSANQRFASIWKPVM